MKTIENLRVLLVEDSTVLKERLSTLIGSLDHVRLVAVADTEDSAVEAAKREDVDVVILDLHLKQGTGFGVMRTLADSGLKPQFVILTNYDLPEYKRVAVSLGAAHFLDKARDFGKVPALLEDFFSAQTNSH